METICFMCCEKGSIFQPSTTTNRSKSMCLFHQLLVASRSCLAKVPERPHGRSIELGDVGSDEIVLTTKGAKFTQ